MHTLPQLRKIERKYGDRVIVVGVHSPKFPAERETANLREAVLRYGSSIPWSTTAPLPSGINLAAAPGRH
jgi:hypothetical protein